MEDSDPAGGITRPQVADREHGNAVGTAGDVPPRNAPPVGASPQDMPRNWRGHPLRLVLLVSTAVILAGAAAVSAYLVTGHGTRQASGQLLRPSGIPPTISTSLADLMALSPVPTAPAPGFTLIDQD